MAKRISVSLSELCAVLADTNSAEECATAIDAYVALKDGTAEKEAEAKRIAEAEEAARAEINREVNRPIIGMFDAVSDALEQAVEEYDEADACMDSIMEFKTKIGRFNISIVELRNGYEVTLNGVSAITEDLDGRSLVALTRFFIQQ